MVHTLSCIFFGYTSWFLHYAWYTHYPAFFLVLQADFYTMHGTHTILHFFWFYKLIFTLCMVHTLSCIFLAGLFETTMLLRTVRDPAHIRTGHIPDTWRKYFYFSHPTQQWHKRVLCQLYFRSCHSICSTILGDSMQNISWDICIILLHKSLSSYIPQQSYHKLYYPDKYEINR